MKVPNILSTWNEERRLLDDGYRLIAGIDEVGRGTLAGPVTAAAVILDPDAHAPYYDELRDSKTLTPRQRERLAASISQSAVGIGIGVAEHSEIDDLGIVKATRLAMTRAVTGLPLPPHHLLIDAVPLPDTGLPFKAIIRGDAKCRSIAAASIVAKVARDRRMTQEEAAHPGYGFVRNKGYATLEHLRSLHRLGPSPIHRRSFAPVRALVEPASTTPPSSRQTRGRIGEQAAADLLRERGFRLLDRNVRYTWGELDLIAIAEDGQTVVFVEVRARTSNSLGSPMESITRAKQQRLVLAAQEYLQRNGLEKRPWRIDLMAYTWRQGTEWRPWSAFRTRSPISELKKSPIWYNPHLQTPETTRPMPTYEYRCQSCRRRSSRLFRSFSQVADVPCPHCGSHSITRLPSTFAIHKSWDSGLNLPSYESMSDFDEDDPDSMAQWGEGMRQDMGDDFGDDFDD